MVAVGVGLGPAVAVETGVGMGKGNDWHADRAKMIHSQINFFIGFIGNL